jgi:hypothetical protein
VWIEKLPFVALSFAFGVRAVIAEAEQGALYPLAEYDVFARLAQACYGVTFYLWKTLCPSDLGPLYQLPPRSVLLGPMLWRSLPIAVPLHADVNQLADSGRSPIEIVNELGRTIVEVELILSLRKTKQQSGYPDVATRLLQPTSSAPYVLP